MSVIYQWLDITISECFTYSYNIDLFIGFKEFIFDFIFSNLSTIVFICFIKNKYFLIIENIRDIELKNIKIRNKFSIIYRNNRKIDKLNDLLRFRKLCKIKAIKFYVANDINLAMSLNSDGIYLSSFNRELKFLNYKRLNFGIIGSAHNFKEISNKIKQGCSSILLSKLFLVDYNKKSPFLGVVKFNSFLKFQEK